MPEPIKVAVITDAGGAHVTAYLSALAATDACAEVVLADPDSRWPDEARKRLGPKFRGHYVRLNELLAKEKPALALVTLEARLAPPFIDAALASGCHILAEKPSCIRIADFEALVFKAESKHRHLMLALANRLNPEFVFARQLIASGRIGNIYGLAMHLIADQTRLTQPGYHRQWFADRERAGGGHLIWLGIHWLDLAMELTGSDITRAAGLTANVGRQPVNIEDSAVASLQFDAGFLGTINSGYHLAKGYHSGIRVWGSKGWLHLEQMLDKPLHWSETEGEQAGKIQEFTGSKNPRGYAPFVAAAVTACAAGTEPPITTRDSLRALRTVFGIYDSARTGQATEIPQ